MFLKKNRNVVRLCFWLLNFKEELNKLKKKRNPRKFAKAFEETNCFILFSNKFGEG